MESEGVSLPLIHEHLMVPWNHLGKGDCCGRSEAITDGYYCKICDFFVHKRCSEFSEYIEHPSHPGHILQLRRKLNPRYCNLCGRGSVNLSYRCEVCDFDMDLYCTKYPPPEDIDISETHHHKLTLYKRGSEFDCGAKCGKIGQNEFSYKCDECDLAFHVDCVWHPPEEVEHPVEYKTIDVGNRVVLPLIHEHLMVPWNDMRKGDCCGHFSSITDGFYCESCDFFVHKKCSESSESIQHPSHSIHTLHLRRNPFNYCDVCAEEVVNLFYRCEICYFDIDLYCLTSPPPDVIDIPGTPSHKLILLKKRIHFDCHAKCGKSGQNEYAYKCHECDLAFHVYCAWHPPEVLPLEVNHPYHSLHPLKLLKGQPPKYSDEICRLCEKEIDNHFYHCSSCNFSLDIPRDKEEICNGCNQVERHVLRCIEDGCEFVLGFNCATLPQVVKHRVDDHPVSLCYGEKASGKCWCDICEQESDTWKWFYTCKDHRASLHTKCVVGDFVGLMPGSTIKFGYVSFILEVLLNNSVSRPFCAVCESHCIYPIILKVLGTSDGYICSIDCVLQSED